MVRGTRTRGTLVQSAVIGALMSLSLLFGVSYQASAAPNDNAIKNPQDTHCNANNPHGGGCPQSGMPQGPVCGIGMHTGNPHCTSPAAATGGL